VAPKNTRRGRGVDGEGKAKERDKTPRKKNSEGILGQLRRRFLSQATHVALVFEDFSN
jgi:hypothetical protein